ncbi:hypothetical protein Tco_0654659 [Tanacetum coccineum]|uniref:Uncharacterized protein n=1 Tax=Tanacetum coccineum TaxID=301880 RepID=A0ABQ4X4R9_9ASTR
MQGSDISQQERHSRLMNEFDKFMAVEGESLTSVYERFSTLMNVIDRNNVCPQEIPINTKFLNSLQLEWSKYVTTTRLSYFHSPQTYDVTPPLSVIDNDDDYQGEIQGDAQEDKLTTAIILLARAITQRYSTPTNNCLRTLSSTRNQSVIQDGRVNIQSKNVGHAWNGNKNVGRQNMNQATNAGNGWFNQLKNMIRMSKGI